MNIKHIASSSEGNAHLVDDLLLDCGVGMDELRANVDITDLAGCLLSHRHSDHSMSTEKLLRAGVNVYASRGTFNALGLSHHRANIVESGQNFHVGDWTVKAFDTVHDCEQPLGFIFAKDNKKGLYLTDSAYSKYRFKGLTHILIECNYAYDIIMDNMKEGRIHPARKDRTIKNHMGLEDVKEFLRASDTSELEEIHLLHLSDVNSDEKRFKREIEELVGVPVVVAGK